MVRLQRASFSKCLQSTESSRALGSAWQGTRRCWGTLAGRAWLTGLQGPPDELVQGEDCRESWKDGGAVRPRLQIDNWHRGWRKWGGEENPGAEGLKEGGSVPGVESGSWLPRVWGEWYKWAVGATKRGFYGKTMAKVAPEYQGNSFTSLTELGTGKIFSWFWKGLWGK